MAIYQVSEIKLTDIIVSVARAVVEANQVLGSGSGAPMGITEFKCSLKVHASVSVPRVVLPARTTLTDAAKKTFPGALRLQKASTMSLRERILTGHQYSADLEVTSTIQPLPKVENI